MRLSIAARLCCFLSLLSPSLQAQDLITIDDAGQPRVFEVMLDEVAVSTPAARRVITAEPKAASVAALKNSARLRTKQTGEEAELVLRERVKDQRHGVPRILTRELLVTVEPGADLAALLGNDATARRAGDGLDHMYLVRAADSPSALDLALRLRASRGIRAAEPLLARQQTRRLVPNDTFFTNQWHLRNTGQFNGSAGNDVRVTNVWDTYRGAGMYIAIIDDGLQTAHPDLSANVNTAIDWDFNFDDNDPNPGTGDDHGTACAGVAAARGNNGLGVSGSAPEATLVGLRLISLASSDSEEADAMNWSNHIIQLKSNSWGPNDNGATLEGPGALTRAALSNACILGRGGRGILNFWAGGNGLDANDDSNYDGYANSIYTIAIGAVANTGIQSWYSESGANLVVVAPSSGDNNSGSDVGIWTTDRTGSSGYSTTDYANDFGGTSSATPLAAGVGALVLQANTNLGWRDVQEILIRTATRNHSGDSDWRTNAAGIWFNHKYGGGMINASGAVARALTWTNLGPQLMVVSNQSGLSVSIPDNSAAGVTRTFTVTNLMRVEHAVLNVSITHASRGHLRIELISPGNTTSVLANTRADTGDNYSDWAFMTVRNWGESAAGTWTVRVADRTAGTAGTLTAARLTLYGTSSATPSNQPPVFAAIGAQTVVQNAALLFGVTATDPADGDPITLSASNLPPGAVFGSTNALGSFQWNPAATLGVFTSRFFAADDDGVATQAVVITCRTNEPPVIAPIPPQNVLVSNLLAFAVTATDPVGGNAITLTASNLPAGAVFGATNGNGHFTWNPASPTGVYAVTFHAADVSGFTTQQVTITVAFGVATNLIINFEGAGETKTSYTNGNVTLSGFSWTLTETLIGTDANDRKNGLRAARMRNTNAVMTMNGNTTGTLGGIRFLHGKYSTDPNSTIALDYSVNGGSTWINAGTVTVSSTTLTLFSTNLNLNVPGRMRIRKVTGSANIRVNIDDIIVLNGGPPAQTPPDLQAIGGKFVLLGGTLSFGVTALETDGDPATLSAGNLPAGAVFSPLGATGTFLWTNAGPAGVYTSIFYAADNDGTNSEAVAITVNAPATGCVTALAFTNSASIDIVDFDVANPYPSEITVAGITNAISKVTVTLRNLTHDFAYDLDILLVGPQGQAVVLVSGIATNGASAANLTWTLDTDAAQMLPVNATLTSGTFRPSDISGFADLAPPAPAAPYSGTLTDFVGQSPSGIWSLYIMDQLEQDAGTLAGGWSLNFTLDCGGAPPPASTNGCGLIISEYIEGSGDSKAIELYNGTSNTIDLAAGNYRLFTYFNGSTVPGLTNALTGSIPPGGTYILAHGGAAQAVLDVADQTHSSGWFTGNDAIVLRAGTNVIDSIGQVGSSAIFGENVTLVRLSAVTSGDTTINNAFSAASEWLSFPQNTFNGLGAHAMNCPAPSPDSDGDGMDDAWEQIHFGSLTNLGAGLDWDADGFLDIEEFWAGTNPTNFASRLQLVETATQPSGSGVVIRWQSASNRVYSVSRSTNLLAGFTVLAAGVTAAPPENVWTDAVPPQAAGHYRIDLE